MTPPFEINEEVYDDLTGKKVKIIGIQMGIGKCGDQIYPDEFPIWGYWVDNSWLGGGRHPWELTSLKEIKNGDAK